MRPNHPASQAKTIVWQRRIHLGEHGGSIGGHLFQAIAVQPPAQNIGGLGLRQFAHHHDFGRPIQRLAQLLPGRLQFVSIVCMRFGLIQFQVLLNRHSVGIRCTFRRLRIQESLLCGRLVMLEGDFDVGQLSIVDFEARLLTLGKTAITKTSPNPDVIAAASGDVLGQLIYITRDNKTLL